jgi:hypothetical protein
MTPIKPIEVKSDELALAQAADEIEVTQAMLDAGTAALHKDYFLNADPVDMTFTGMIIVKNPAEMVKRLFQAMIAAKQAEANELAASKFSNIR